MKNKFVVIVGGKDSRPKLSFAERWARALEAGARVIEAGKAAREAQEAKEVMTASEIRAGELLQIARKARDEDRRHLIPAAFCPVHARLRMVAESPNQYQCPRCGRVYRWVLGHGLCYLTTRPQISGPRLVSADEDGEAASGGG